MGISRGNITTNIIKKGLVFNMDAANKASTVPSISTTTSIDNINKITGTYTNGSTLQLTKPISFNLDGTDDYINCGDSNIFSFGDGSNDSPFSLNVWVNWDDLDNYTCLISKDAGGSNREWALLENGSNKIRIFIKNQGGNNQQSIDSTTTYSTGQWYNITATYDGRGGNTAYQGLSLYTNGNLETVSANQASTYTAMSNTSANLEIGRYYNDNLYCINAQIGPTQIYNRALSASEVLFNYNGLKGRFE